MSTIRHRLMWRLLAWQTAFLRTGAILTIAVMREALTHQFDDALGTKLMALASSVEMEDGHLGFDRSDQNTRQFDNANPVLFFQIWDSVGHEITRSQSLANDLLPSPHHATQVPELWDMRLTKGLPVRVASLVFSRHLPTKVRQLIARSEPSRSWQPIAVDWIRLSVRLLSY